MKKIFAGALTLLAVLAVSCTVSEPDSTDIPVGSDARLVSLSYYGMNLMHVSYDAQRRVTEIRVGDPEEYDLTALSFKNAMFSRKACYFIGEMPEWERRFPYSFL